MAAAGLENVALYVDELRADDVLQDLRDKTEDLLEEAEDIVDGAATDAGATLEARLADGRIRQRALVRVEAEMVAGVLQNPDCYISSSESVGGVSQSRTLDLKTANGRLRLTDDQREQLGLPASSKGKGRGRAFTVNPGTARCSRAPDAPIWRG